jgi:hypothetical protein
LREQRLLILVHAQLTSFPAFQAVAAQAGLALPDFASLSDRHRGRDRFIGVIAFKPDWTAYFLPFGFSDASDVYERERILRQGLRAALEPQGFAIGGEASQSAIRTMWLNSNSS